MISVEKSWFGRYIQGYDERFCLNANFDMTQLLRSRLLFIENGHWQRYRLQIIDTLFNYFKIFLFALHNIWVTVTQSNPKFFKQESSFVQINFK